MWRNCAELWFFYQQVFNSQLAQESLFFFIKSAFLPVPVNIKQSSGDTMLRTHAWYVDLITLSSGYEMACHIQSTTEATPVRWKQSLMGVLICKTIALFHCVSFDCFIELQVFHQVAWTSIIYTEKNGYPSIKEKRQRKSRNHTVHV